METADLANRNRMGEKVQRLRDKRAVVTAAGQGIGQATALAMAAEGATVYACDRDEGLLAALPALPGLVPVRLDACDAGAIARFASDAGPVDVLFNGVGQVHVGSILDCDEAAWARSLEVNVTSMYRMIRALLPAMIERGGGSIVNMSSVQSSVRGFPNRFAYGTTKAAVIGMTKAIAADHAKDRIRCNAICPSAVDSPSMRARIADTPDPAATLTMFSQRQPLGRMGRPEEIALLAVYLASDESAFVTGTAVVIDGGAVM
jgi:NAD(P)-dependent dehydrogenase (short-subunit alcohol dehydrogenase family)